MLRVLAFFAPDTETFRIIRCFRLYLEGGDFFCHFHKLPVAVAGLVNFNSPDIDAGHCYAKALPQPRADSGFRLVIYERQPAFKLNHRNVVLCRSICDNCFDIARRRIPDLRLEIIKAKGVQAVQPDEFPVIADPEAQCAPDRGRDAEVREPWVIDVKKRDAELNLNDLGKVDKVDFRLERRASGICKSHN